MSNKEILRFMRIIEAKLSIDEQGEYINEGLVRMKHVYSAVSEFIEGASQEPPTKQPNN